MDWMNQNESSNNTLMIPKQGLKTIVLYARAEISKAHIVNVSYSWFNLQVCMPVSKGLPIKDCLMFNKRTAVVFALERNTYSECYEQLTGKPRPDLSPLSPLIFNYPYGLPCHFYIGVPPRDYLIPQLKCA